MLEKRRYTALEKWTEALESVHNAVINKSPTNANRMGGDGGFGFPGEALGFREFSRFDAYWFVVRRYHVSRSVFRLVACIFTFASFFFNRICFHTIRGADTSFKHDLCFEPTP